LPSRAEHPATPRLRLAINGRFRIALTEILSVSTVKVDKSTFKGLVLMSLRKKAKDTRPLNAKSWLSLLDEKTRSEVKDLWDGYLQGEYSAAHARRILESELNLKVSRSSFADACNNAWGKKT